MRRQRDKIGALIRAFVRLAWWVPFALAVVAGFGVPAFARIVADGMVFESILPVAGPVTGLVLTLAGAAAQVEKLRHRRFVAQARALEDLREMSRRDFELACAEAFARRGYDVAEVTRDGGGDVDLVLRSGDETTFVRCAHYRRRHVNVHAVRELLDVMASEGAHAGIVVTTGSFTRPARDLAADQPLELLAGADLLALLKGVDPESLPEELPVAVPAMAVAEREHVGKEEPLRVATVEHEGEWSAFWDEPVELESPPPWRPEPQDEVLTPEVAPELEIAPVLEVAREPASEVAVASSVPPELEIAPALVPASQVAPEPVAEVDIEPVETEPVAEVDIEPVETEPVAEVDIEPVAEVETEPEHAAPVSIEQLVAMLAPTEILPAKVRAGRSGRLRLRPRARDDRARHADVGA